MHCSLPTPSSMVRYQDVCIDTVNSLQPFFFLEGSSYNHLQAPICAVHGHLCGFLYPFQPPGSYYSHLVPIALTSCLYYRIYFNFWAFNIKDLVWSVHAKTPHTMIQKVHLISAYSYFFIVISVCRKTVSKCKNASCQSSSTEQSMILRKQFLKC